MFLGIILIAAGVLIALYPALLSIIVASLLIFVGLGVVAVVLVFRRQRKHSSNPVVEFFFRY